MKGKSQALGLDQPVLKKVSLGRIKWSAVALVLGLLVLVVATTVLVLTVVRPGRAPGIESGIEASSARWTALGEYFTSDHQAISSADSARWSALGAHYAAEAASEKFVDTVWAFEEAFQASDVDQILGFYAPDAVSLPPGYPPSVGRETIEADLRWLFDEFELEREFALVDYKIAGTYATRLGEWTQTLTPRSGGEPIVETGRCIVGFERVRGKWLIVWEIWNTYEPLQP